MLSSESVSKSVSKSGSGSWWLSTDSDYEPPSWAVEEEEDKDLPDYDDRVFKVDDNYDSNDDEDQQQQQQLVFKLDSLGYPACYKFSESFAEIVGSCHGIVCLYDRHGHQDVSLWNPATRQFRVLPKSITADEYYADPLLAFGFDVKTKDYKVLLLTCLNVRNYRQLAPAECRCHVQVYSLSTNSWRFLEGITCLPGFPIYSAIEGRVLYLNGSCFFVAKFLYTRTQRCFPENNRFLIKFDFTKETFTPMRLPDHHRDQELYLSSLGDKIAIFTVSCYVKDNDNNDIWITEQQYNFYTGMCSQVFNIWVLNEHNGIWTELHSFRIDRKRPGEWILPRGLSDDGEFAMLETTYSTGLAKKMMLYNLVTKEVKKNFLSCSRLMSEANAYKPSLVSCSSNR